MLKRVLAVGLLAGLVAGLAMAVLQHLTTTPLILAAEAYEIGHDHAGHDHGADGHPAPAAPAWSPADGIERTLSTTGATVVSAIGFALVLVAVLIIAGETITPLTALAYAAGGFAATGLATALGIAPELPGSAGAALADRQAWWIGTALATAVGLYLLARAPFALARPLGALLLVAPHAIGAPVPAAYESTVPAELAAHFAATSLVVHAVFWAMVGAAVGVFWQRFERA